MSGNIEKWEMVKLGDISETITKGTTPTTIGFDFQREGINFIKIESISDTGQFLPEMFKHISIDCNEKLFRSKLVKNDILFSIAGALGRVALVTEDVIPANINQALAIIRIPDNVVNYQYLFFALKSEEVLKQFEKQKRGNSQQNLSLDDVKNIKIPFPPLEEQNRIVKVIETKLTAVEKAKTANNKQISIIEKLFDSYVESIYKNENWNKVKLGDIAMINPSTRGKIPDNNEICVSFIPMTAVDAITGTIKNSENKKLSEVRKGYTYFENEDILFAKITPCMENGKSAIARNLQNEIGFGSTEFHVIKTSESILPEWVHFYIRQKKYLKDAKNYMTGSVGQQRLPDDYLFNTLIPLPPLEEQKKIVTILKKKQTILDKICKCVTEQSTYINALPSSILRKAFNGDY